MSAQPRAITARWFEPVDPASLALFRIAFGAILLLEVVRFFAAGWITEYYVEPAFHFTYPGLGWVRPLPEGGLNALFAVLAICAAGLTIGLASRLCALLFCLGFGYAFLLEQGRYLNHFYLVVLLALLLAWVPSGNAWSVDALLRRRALAVPRWSLDLLRAQIGIVYLYAGIAKLNPDWLRAEPLLIWLPRHGDLPLIGPALREPWCAWFFSYGGLLLDLLAWPLLAWKRTRLPTFMVVAAFHLTNATIFGIGIFPWMTIAATTLFFAPDWPRRLLRRRAPVLQEARPTSSARRRLVVGSIGVYLAFQVLFPLRHLLYPGSVHWTEEGHAFAWHMMLRTKSGRATFRVEDADTGEQWLVDPRHDLEPWQARKLVGRPGMILQYAHHLAERERAQGRERVRVYATVETSLNGRRPQLLVDPEVDLAAERRGLLPATWIRALTEPLRPPPP